MNLDERIVWRTLQGVLVLIVAGFFLFSMRAMLNPLVLFFLLWGVMAPFRGRPGHTPFLVIALGLTLLWLLSTTGSVLAPFVLAVVLAYILDPLVDKVESRRIPRSLAIVLLSLPVAGGLVALLLLGIPAALGQLGELIQKAPDFFVSLADWLEEGRRRLLSVNLPFMDEEALLERLRGIDSEAIVAFLQERQEAIAGAVSSGILGVGRGLGSVFGVVSYVVLTPVLTFYLLRDWNKITRQAGELLPAAQKDSIISFAHDFDDLLSKYLRGQLTVAAALGALTALGLFIVGFPYAWMLGLLVGVLSIVPYLGLVVSLIPAIFIAFVSGSVGASLLKLAFVFTVTQMLEGTVISPRIVGDSVGLHPVWVVLALALGGFFFGFVGLLIGVPIAAGMKLLILRGLEAYKASAFFQGRTPA